MLFASVRNVLRKDWAYSRWNLVAVLAALTLATLCALPQVQQALCSGQCFAQVEASQNVLQTVYVLLAVAFVVTVIQNDSPTDLAVFWVAQPVKPQAVFAAKLAYALALIVIVSVVAQALWLASVGMSLGESSFVLRLTAYWVTSAVLFVALIASVTGGAQAFLLVLSGLCVLRVLQGSGAIEMLATLQFVSAMAPGFRADVWMLVAVTALGWIYVTIRVGRTSKLWIVGVVLVLLTLKWDSADSRGLGLLTRTVEVPDQSLPAINISLTRHGSEFHVRFQTTAPPPGRRYALITPRIHLKFDQVRDHDLRNSYGEQVLLVPDVVPGSATIEPQTVSVTISARRLNGRMITDSLVQLYVIGFLREEAYDTVLTLPLDGNADSRAGATRFRLVEADNRERAAHLALDVLTVGQRPLFVRQDNIDFEGLAESWRLEWESRLPVAAFEYFAVDSAGTGTIKLIPSNSVHVPTAVALPATGVSHERLEFQPVCQARSAIACGPEWWKGNRLLVRQWRHVRYKPLRATFKVSLR